MYSLSKRQAGVLAGALLALAAPSCGGLCGSSSEYTYTPPIPIPSGRFVTHSHGVGSVSPHPSVPQKELVVDKTTLTVTISYVLEGKTVVEKYRMVDPYQK